jgi:hypothetical protein
VTRRPAPRSAATRAAAVLAGALLIVLAGCSSKPPVISRVVGRVIYTQDVRTHALGETLGVYLVASDPDGMENLSAFYVINDQQELFWKVDHAAWSTTTAEGETWVGASGLSMPGSGPVPAGTWRVVLQNVDGTTVEDTVTIPVRDVTPQTAKFPSASTDKGVITVSGAVGPVEIWVYGSDGGFAGAFPLQSGVTTLAESAVKASSPALAGGFTFRVFAWSATGGYGVVSGPYTAAR